MYMQVVFVYGLVSPGHTHGVSGLPQAFFSSGKQHALLEMSVLVDIVPLGEVHTAVVFYIYIYIIYIHVCSTTTPAPPRGSARQKNRHV